MIIPDVYCGTARVEREWAGYYKTVAKPAKCARCSGDRIAWDGSRTRSASLVIAGVVVRIAEMQCRRVKCSQCGLGWTLRPPGLCAHKHYQPCVVAQAASRYLFDPHSTQTQVAAEHGCRRRTVGRWIRWLAGIAEPAMLLKKVLGAVDAPVLPRQREVAQCERKARGGIEVAVLERAAEVLGLLEDLGSALGQEPPGLRAVLKRVVGNRAGVATYARPLIPEFARGASG